MRSKDINTLLLHNLVSSIFEPLKVSNPIYKHFCATKTKPTPPPPQRWVSDRELISLHNSPEIHIVSYSVFSTVNLNPAWRQLMYTRNTGLSQTNYFRIFWPDGRGQGATIKRIQKSLRQSARREVMWLGWKKLCHSHRASSLWFQLYFENKLWYDLAGVMK